MYKWDHTHYCPSPLSLCLSGQISIFGHWVQYGKGQKACKCTFNLWTVNSQGGRVCVWLWGHNLMKLLITQFLKWYIFTLTRSSANKDISLTENINSNCHVRLAHQLSVYNKNHSRCWLMAWMSVFLFICLSDSSQQQGVDHGIVTSSSQLAYRAPISFTDYGEKPSKGKM